MSVNNAKEEFEQDKLPLSGSQAGIDDTAQQVTPTGGGTDSVSRSRQSQKRRPRPCHYFNTPKGCRLGDSCPFRHSKKGTVDIPKERAEEIEVDRSRSSSLLPSLPISVPAKATARFIPAKFVVTREQKGEEAQLDARNHDVCFFKRRFPKCIQSTYEDSDVFTFNYRITDPDWVFDVRSIKFCIILQRGHPVEIPSLELSRDNRVLPDLLTSHLQGACNDALKVRYATFESKNAFEPIGRTLVRWLDRNILRLFVEGLKKTKLITEAEAAGIRLIVPDPSPAQAVENNEINGEAAKCPSDRYSGVDLSQDLAQMVISDRNVNGNNEESQNAYAPLQSIPRIEVVLVWRDSSRNIASISSLCLHICTKCARCGQEHDQAVPVKDQPVGWRCKRCQLPQSLRLRPELVHENSSVAALLEARGCRPLDCILQQSQLRFVCLTCGKEDDVQKLNFGSTHKSWCRECHTLCEFTISAVRFRGDFSKIATEDLLIASKIPKAKKEVKTVGVIVEGQPLPELGTCKHYRKSYRWFRFPCCGRTFPCDVCHEDFFTGEHEMKVANRMICGHCSKEQVYTVGKPCVNCNASVTRSRSHFWEGGKGCRDQVLMSRNDVHKFVHNRKTVPKKKTRPPVQKK